jgi:histidyl-tRNA synthetase (EC 6.1.1.21)
MGEDDRRRLRDNPLRVLDTKDPALAAALAGAPRVLDHLDPASKAHHEELLALLDASGIPYRVEPRLVRGLDYYTRTVFEVTAQGLGAQDALLGGGRYDRLVSDLGGPRTPGIGFAIGEDRLVDVLPEPFRRGAIDAFAPSPRGDRSGRPRRRPRARRRAPQRGRRRRPRPGRERAGSRAEERREARLPHGRPRRREGAAVGVVVVKDLVERSQREVPIGDLPRTLKGETP